MRWVQRFGLAMMVFVLFSMLGYLMPDDVNYAIQYGWTLVVSVGFLLFTIPKRGEQ